MLAIVNKIVRFSTVKPKKKAIPEMPSKINNPKAGASIKCLIASPSVSIRLAVANPGRIDNIRPRIIVTGLLFRFQTICEQS